MKGEKSLADADKFYVSLTGLHSGRPFCSSAECRTKGLAS